MVAEPRETDELLCNPYMGWQTFHRFADEDENLEGLPSSVAYFRFRWSELEPRDGEINFSLFEELLERAREAGQRLAFRVMCAGTDPRNPPYSPEWLGEKGVEFYEYTRQGSGRFYVPDMDSTIFQDHHFRFLKVLGERFDDHPDLDLVDIGTVGLWGEWHMSGTEVDMPCSETCPKIIDCYREAFPKSLKAMLIGAVNIDLPGQGDAHRYGLESGAGWRADCLGDLDGFSKTWNHMTNCYPQAVKNTGAEGAWKSAPVAFESCWDMRKWVVEGWDVRYIFDYALSYHASYINNKSAPIPNSTRSEVERFLQKLGYRLVLRRIEAPDIVNPGAETRINMLWENVGVAPPYGGFLLIPSIQARHHRESSRQRPFHQGLAPREKRNKPQSKNTQRTTTGQIHPLSLYSTKAGTLRSTSRSRQKKKTAGITSENYRLATDYGDGSEEKLSPAEATSRARTPKPHTPGAK